MDALLKDLRFAMRTLGKSPGFSAIVVLTLGLGIGANTAIFTLLDQVLLRLLPVERPEELVLLDGPGANMGARFGEQVFSYPCIGTSATRTRSSPGSSRASAFP